MRIYKAHIEHKQHGRNYSSETVDARTFNEAVKKAEKLLTKQERIEWMELLAATD